ncbi:MAG: cbb3-type cytochrome c oxidase subunit I [Bradyrhizobium sp.]|nr:cbb3-type cytochrome c oxidase subunit I [Bradyrhizobium sp.]
MSASSPTKSMTIGESGLSLTFAVTAFLCVFAAAKALDTAFAFHASLAAAASAASVFFILNRYFERGELPPQEINGRPNYNLGPIKFSSFMAMFWGIAGFAVGLIIASQLAWPALNFDLPWTSFGRLRPLHTSAVIFAFGGNVLLATSFYVVQRTCRVRLAGDLAPWFVVIGYNFFILIAGTGYLLGVTEGKEYAEPEWYSDLWLTIVWVVYLLVFLVTVIKRKEPHIFVANWFYLAFIVTIAVLHLGNNPALPVSFFGSKSYIAWGGMINGLMTLSGAWDKLRTDPVLRMLVVSVAFYGMSTFEGPMMSIKVVNSLSHYTDWTIGHVHSGALGWVGFVSFGALYCLVPWIWNRKGLYSLKLVNWHFWTATLGIVLYISAMWVSGILQGLMWRSYTALGFLEYSFIETVEAMHPFYIIRAAGGALFLIGSLIMAYNLWMTVRVGEEEVQSPVALQPAE